MDEEDILQVSLTAAEVKALAKLFDTNYYPNELNNFARIIFEANDPGCTNDRV